MKSHFKVMRERMKEEALLAVFFSLSHAHAHAPMKERAVRDFFRLFFSSSTTIYILRTF